MGTNLTYNGVTLAHVLTREFEQTKIDDKSGTDRIGYKFRITVDTIANITALANGFGVSGVIMDAGSSAVDIIAAVRSLLMAKRQAYSYSIDGSVLVSGDNTTDIENGPNPIHLSITNVTKTTIRIVYTLEFSTVGDCSSYPNLVLNNRWASTDDIDEQFRITRSWQGVLRLGSSVQTTASLRAFRRLCVPTLQAGYRRTKMSFVVDPTGLEIGYQIVDQQMLGDAPPGGACKWSYDHTEAFSVQGMNNRGMMNIRLHGFPRGNKSDMIAFGIRVFLVKMLPSTSGRSWIQNLTIVDHGGDSDNSIDISGAVIRVPKADTGTTPSPIGILRMSTIGQTIGSLGLSNYNADKCVLFGPTGTDDPATLAGIFACYLQTQCDANYHPIPATPSGGTTTTPSPATTPAPYTPAETSVSIGSPGDLSIGSYTPSTGHEAAVYTYARLEVRIEQANMFIGLPIGRASSDSNTSTQALIKLSNGTCKKIVRYTAERIGQWPQLWNPVVSGFTDTQGIIHRLSKFRPIFQAPTITGDGQSLNSFDGEYEFVMNRCPNWGNENVSVASLPWDTLLPADVAVPTATWIALNDTNNGIQ